MRFKVDENLPLLISQILRENGHDSITIQEQNMVGKPDEAIAKIIQIEKRALFTLDMGFADLRLYSPKDYRGIIVLRPRRQDKKSITILLKKILPLLKKKNLDGFLWIVDESKIRIRGE